MKVLSIGNEYSQDAHTYLPTLAKAAGYDLTLCNLFLENASIEDHYRNYIDENEVYTYECFLPGADEPMRPDGIALHEAVEDEEWDIVIFNQSHALSGNKESYMPFLGELAAYCKLMCPNTKVFLSETPAYENGCPLKEFTENYQRNQNEMYSAIANACKEVADEAEMDSVIEVAKTWQYLRQTAIGDRLTRDGCYGNELGQFASSCAYFKAIFEKSATESGYNLPDYDKAFSELVKLCSD